MIHVFQIHSYTCYITALGVINEESIPLEKIVFLLCRNLPIIQKEIKHVRIDDELYYFPYLRNNQLYNFKFLKSKEKIEQVDKIIEGAAEDQFIYYVHNAWNQLYRVIISHKNCFEVRFIEDGLDMYLDKKSYHKKYPTKVWLRHKIVNYVLGNILGVYDRLKQVDNPFANKGTEIQKIFGLTNASFKKFLDPKYSYTTVDTELVKTCQDYKLEEGSNLFVFTALVEQHVTQHKDIQSLLEWFIGKFNIKSIHLNFHPHQSENTRAKLINVFENLEVKVIIIPDEIIMEVLFINNRKLNVYGTGTSLLIYATYFSPSSRVYALYPYFKKHLNKETIRTKFWRNTFDNIKSKNFYLYLRDFK